MSATMICVRCHKEAALAPFCGLCGAKQEVTPRATKKRGNGQGSVYKLPNGKYKAVVVLGYYHEDGKLRKTTRSRVCDKKKDAIAILPELFKAPPEKREVMTFKALYDKWLPTHRASKSTLDCYKAAIKYFRSVWHMRIPDIDVDDLQECIDDCPKGKRTKQNMKATCGLLYKYGIPRKVVPDRMNLAEYLIVDGDGPAKRQSFTDDQIKLIHDQIGSTPFADYVYCLIYLGFRPTEFLEADLANYHQKERYLVGGAKTEAGMNRIVTISPKIADYVSAIAGQRTDGPIFCNADGKPFSLKEFTDAFYAVLDAAGIDNPMVEVGGGVKRHQYTPHSCRHTFATLLKRVDGSSKDKQELIGHASEEMLVYYQDAPINDLRKITDAI